MAHNADLVEMLVNLGEVCKELDREEYLDMQQILLESGQAAALLPNVLKLLGVVNDAALVQADSGQLDPERYMDVMKAQLALEDIGKIAGARLTRYSELASSRRPS